jgi:cell division protein FtsI (penicillin-binding protein 3)
VTSSREPGSRPGRPGSRPAGSSGTGGADRGAGRTGGRSAADRRARSGVRAGGRPPARGGGPPVPPPGASRRGDAGRRSSSCPPARRRRPVRLGHQGVRLRAGLLSVLVLLSLIAGRLVWLQGVTASAYADQAVEQRLRTTTLLAPRGAITDRNGQVLALSVDARAVYAEPRTIARAIQQKPCKPESERPCTPAQIAEALAPVLGLPERDLTERLSRPLRSDGTCTSDDPMACSGFVYLARGLDPDLGTAVRELRLVGVGVLSEPKRVHPGGDLGANVIGFTALDDTGGTKGAAGVELAADHVLAGRDGRSTAEVDGSGRIIPQGQRTVQEPVAGRDVQLTIDRDLQWYAQDVLASKVAESDAESGTATVIDVQTGEILALASVPTFDADSPSSAPAEVRGNRAVTDVFEPGSIGKVITAAIALEDGVLTPDSVMSVPDHIQVSNKRFTDSHSHPVERMTLTGVMVESSNVGTIMAAQLVGGARLHEGLQQFGIGQKTGIGLPGESSGILRPESEWSGTDYGTHPIGQGYAVNGVQMASVYATVANDGVRMPPRVVKGSADEDGDVVPVDPPAPERVISSEVAADLRGMLEGVTGEGGTAKIAAIDGYRVAGKTGTARRAMGGGYSGYTASFVGFAPADAPRIAISVSVQDPKNGYYGGVIAAPVFRDIMAYALSNQQVPPTGAPAPRLRLREGDPL